MFCMNCGQVLPDGAKFCLNCGTNQGAVSPNASSRTETINLDGTHTFVPAMCPNCSAHMKVDSSSKIAHCDACGTECLVQDAMKALTVKGNVQVGSATINVNGTNTDSLLQRVEIMLADGDFSGAMSKCDTILDSDPTNGKVYFFMLLSDLGCKSRNDLANQPAPFDGNQYYIKAIRYGDDNLKSELLGYISAITDRNEAKQNNPSVGDIIHYGINNGQKMWWKVLKTQGRMAMIITTYNICEMKYHQPYIAITWHDCTLRKWLNNEFYNGYFTQDERAKILPCKLINDNNPNYGTLGGAPTTDKVFLLSINEVNTLFANNQARANGSWWWLRSPGCEPRAVANVESDGEVDASGYRVGSDGGVRPVIWIKLD